MVRKVVLEVDGLNIVGQLYLPDESDQAMTIVIDWLKSHAQIRG